MNETPRDFFESTGFLVRKFMEIQGDSTQITVQLIDCTEE
jgi:hypothetical protein